MIQCNVKKKTNPRRRTQEMLQNAWQCWKTNSSKQYARWKKKICLQVFWMTTLTGRTKRTHTGRLLQASGSATEKAPSPNDSRVLGISRVRVFADRSPLRSCDRHRASVPCDQQGTVVHYPVYSDKRVCIVRTLLAQLYATSGDHVAETSRDSFSEHQEMLIPSSPKKYCIILSMYYELCNRQKGAF